MQLGVLPFSLLKLTVKVCTIFWSYYIHTLEITECTSVYMFTLP